MLRRLFTITLVATAVLLAGFSASASAQDEGTCDEYNRCVGPSGTAVPITPTPVGGVGNAFAEQDSPDASAAPTTAPTAEATADTAAPELAFTGSETETLAYVGSALIAAGGVALVVRRRITED